MIRKILLRLIWLLILFLSTACEPSLSELEVRSTSVATDVIKTQADVLTPTQSPIPTTTSAPTPVVPSDFEGIEDLIPLFNYDADADRDLDLGQESVQIQDISYISPMGGRVTGFLVVPPGEGPFAGIIYMHGAQGSRSSFLDEAVRMAELGAVSLLIDGLPSRPEPWRRESAVADLTLYRSIQIQTTIDLRCGVEVLLSLPDVDASRLGFVGHGYGAILGSLLAGVEHRIKAYVLMAGYPRFSDALPPELRTEQFTETMDPIDPIHYIGNAAPSALFFQYGFDDESLPPDLALNFIDYAREPRLVKFYETGHMLNYQAFLDRAEWMTTQLGLGGG